ncbi:formimidoylglutamate deiminase [Sphingobium sp. SCG-1]|uniref:formimidoylglutamate deiminase n=1 Tax=Sphingobium sp. SCG-1 TaxID=2072936 RepID=UPI000CD6B755|nr:formimidoylglutamate deiminase [Sphingobium sp. SCG-1]AUW59775.1 formimidoylglutamate deiminase [Sphingobium sp. SCG-1]
MKRDLSGQGPSIFFRRALLPDGWANKVRILVRSGQIEDVQIGVEAERTDERHDCGLPGVPNLHSHAFQRAMAGLAERSGATTDDFWTWRDLMYRSLDRLTPDMLRAIAALAYVEMLESGFTRVGEFHYVHHDPHGRAYDDLGEMSGAIAAAAAQSGIGLTLLPVLYSHGGFGAQAPNRGQRRFITDLDGYERLLVAAERVVRDLPDALVSIAPHSLRAVSPEQLSALPQIARDRQIHIHIAEQVKEVDACLAWSGQRPVEWLLGHVPVDHRWCLVHATHLTANEMHALVQSGATVGLCPITEANLGDGLFPVEAYQAAGGSFGIGSDSNVLIDASEELRLLEYGQRLSRHGRNILAGGSARSTGRSIFDAAVAGGGNALGVASGLRIGAAADIISLNEKHVSLAGKTNESLIDAFIFAGGKAAIDCVWRYGDKLVENGRHRLRHQIACFYIKTLEKLFN